MKFHLFFGLIVFSSVCFDAYGQMIDSVERKRNEYEKLYNSNRNEFGLKLHASCFMPMVYSF